MTYTEEPQWTAWKAYLDALVRSGVITFLSGQHITINSGVYVQVSGQGVTIQSGEIITTQDTGVNTNPERWLQDNHWEPTAEVTIAVAGAPGEQSVGGAVPAGETRRIREVTVRHAGTDNTVVSILDATGGNVKISIDMPAQSTRTWSSQDGREIAETLQPVIQTSDVTGGSTFVTVAGVEAAQT